MRPLVLLPPLAVLLRASLAFADPPDVPGPVFRFNYKVMPGAMDCPMEEDAHTLFGVHFGYDPFSPEAEDTLFVVVRRKPGRLRVDMSVRDASGSVEWEDFYEGNVHCWGAVLTAAFKAAVRFVPPPSPPVCPACPPPEPAPPPIEAPPLPAPPVERAPKPKKPTPQPAPGPSPPVRFELSAGLSSAYGLPPGFSLGPVLSFDARMRWLTVGIGLSGRFALSEQLDGGISIPTAAYTGELFACAPYKWFLGCGLIQIGHLGTYPGAAISEVQEDPAFGGFGLRVAGQWPIAGRYSIRPYIDAVIPTKFNLRVAHRYSVATTERAWRSPFIFGTLGVTAVVTLP